MIRALIIRLSCTNVGAGACGPQVVAVYPSPAPKVLSATLRNDLSEVSIAFDGPTDGAHLGPDTDCSKVLTDLSVAALGRLPRCAFPGVAKAELVVTLGTDAAVNPRGAADPTVLELRARAVGAPGGLSENATWQGTVQLADPRVSGDRSAVSGPVTAVLSVPRVVGKCAAVVVDAAGSGGAGGRPLRYTFEVAGSGPKLAALAALMASASERNDPTVEVPHDAMDAGIFRGSSASIFLEFSISLRPDAMYVPLDPEESCRIDSLTRCNIPEESCRIDSLTRCNIPEESCRIDSLTRCNIRKKSCRIDSLTRCNIPDGDYVTFWDQVTYTFAVVVRNFLGREARANTNVTKSARDLPHAAVAGGAHRTAARAADLALAGEIALTGPGGLAMDRATGACVPASAGTNGGDRLEVSEENQ
eukprot:1196244-Prorocentrum_minimum.AAC.3